MSTPIEMTPMELMYEQLARAIDSAGPANESLFLAKLALALGHRLADAEAFAAAIAEGLADLPGSSAD